MSLAARRRPNHDTSCTGKGSNRPLVRTRRNRGASPAGSGITPVMTPSSCCHTESCWNESCVAGDEQYLGAEVLSYGIGSASRIGNSSSGGGPAHLVEHDHRVRRAVNLAAPGRFAAPCGHRELRLLVLPRPSWPAVRRCPRTSGAPKRRRNPERSNPCTCGFSPSWQA